MFESNIFYSINTKYTERKSGMEFYFEEMFPVSFGLFGVRLESGLDSSDWAVRLIISLSLGQ